MNTVPETKTVLEIDGRKLTLAEVEAVAKREVRVALAEEARDRVLASRRHIDAIVASSRVVYGVNTGFGKLAEVRIASDQLEQLQLNLLRSHACGVGHPFAPEVVRAMLLLRANVLATGYAGCRPELIDAILALLEADVLPIVPIRGSVGACGDLAPLAHLALVLVGEGEAFVDGQRVDGATALATAGLEPIRLAPKEGLALINGTQASVAVAALAVRRARRVLDAADMIAAMTIDALLGTDAAFADELHSARPHPGQLHSAAAMRHALAGSELLGSHPDCGRVQDAYSLRCSPQVHGSARDTLEHTERVLSIELNSATDNPMVLADGQVVSGGNFHGAPVAAVADFLAIALTDAASISERRTYRLLDPGTSGLPAFLTPNPGLCSGLMMAQVTAAALLSECRSFASPASVDSIPTSAGQEDHVSMSTLACRQLAQCVELYAEILGIEVIAAAQAIEMRRPLMSSEPIEAAIHRLRDHIAPLAEDRALSGDIRMAASLIEGFADLVSQT